MLRICNVCNKNIFLRNQAITNLSFKSLSFQKGLSTVLPSFQPHLYKIFNCPE